MPITMVRMKTIGPHYSTNFIAPEKAVAKKLEFSHDGKFGSNFKFVKILFWLSSFHRNSCGRNIIKYSFKCFNINGKKHFALKTLWVYKCLKYLNEGENDFLQE